MELWREKKKKEKELRAFTHTCDGLSFIQGNNEFGETRGVDGKRQEEGHPDLFLFHFPLPYTVVFECVRVWSW